MTGGEYQLFASGKNFETKMTTLGNRLHSPLPPEFCAESPQPELHEIHVRLRRPRIPCSSGQTIGHKSQSKLCQTLAVLRGSASRPHNSYPFAVRHIRELGAAAATTILLLAKRTSGQ